MRWKCLVTDNMSLEIHIYLSGTYYCKLGKWSIQGSSKNHQAAEHSNFLPATGLNWSENTPYGRNYFGYYYKTATSLNNVSLFKLVVVMRIHRWKHFYSTLRYQVERAWQHCKRHFMYWVIKATIVMCLVPTLRVIYLSSLKSLVTRWIIDNTAKRKVSLLEL